MKRTGAFLLALLCVLAVFSGCGKKDDSKFKYSYAKLSGIGDYFVEDGRVTFAQKEDRSTSFRWGYELISGELPVVWDDFVVQTADTGTGGAYSDPGSAAGTADKETKAGYHVFQFEPSGKGTAEIMIYQYNESGTGNAIKSHTYTVTYDKKGNITVEEQPAG